MTWHNWAGNESARPSKVLAPSSADEVAAAVRQAREMQRTIRMVGSGHSFTGVAVADDIQLRPDRLNGLRSVDVENNLITIEAGMNLAALCSILDEHGLALTNMGDIRKQTIAGAISTSTHGTGRESGTFGQMVREVELVDAAGNIVTLNADNDHDYFQCARVGLGAYGILTAVTLAVEPAFRLNAFETSASFDETVANFDKWNDEHDHVEFFWFPHTTGCLVKHNDRTTDPAKPVGKYKAWWEDDFLSNTVFGALNRLGRAAPGYVPRMNKIAAKTLSTRQYTDVSWKVFTSERNVKFLEMEYALPREQLMHALRELKELLDNGPWRITFPVEVRSVPGDDPWLSTAHGRETGYIAVHAFQRTDFDWFKPAEAIFRAHGGRPHWGKLNTRTAADLADSYPRWNDAMAVRDRVDPQRIFANAYVDRVFGH